MQGSCRGHAGELGDGLINGKKGKPLREWKDGEKWRRTGKMGQPLSVGQMDSTEEQECAEGHEGNTGKAKMKRGRKRQGRKGCKRSKWAMGEAERVGREGRRRADEDTRNIREAREPGGTAERSPRKDTFSKEEAEARAPWSGVLTPWSQEADTQTQTTSRHMPV